MWSEAKDFCAHSSVADHFSTSECVGVFMYCLIHFLFDYLQ